VAVCQRGDMGWRTFGAFVAGVLAAGFVMGSLPATSTADAAAKATSFYACVDSHGAVKVLLKGSRCAAHRTRIILGVAGATGARGPTGPAGPSGQTGPTGVTGQPGSSGLRGVTGPMGATTVVNPLKGLAIMSPGMWCPFGTSGWFSLAPYAAVNGSATSFSSNALLPLSPCVVQ
jgi:Collagen triple helix repeat (20 copies)